MFSIVGASIGNVGLFSGDNKCFLGGAICVVKLNDDVNVDFIYYCTESEFVQKQIRQNTKGAGQATITVDDIRNFIVPVPPIEVQLESVRILDNFTKLTAELTAELTARKKQYEYYKYHLLNETEEKAILGDIAYYSKERINAKNISEKNYVGVDNLLQNCAGKVNSSHVPEEGRLTRYKENDILIGNIRPYLKKIWFADNFGGTNGDVLVVRIYDTQKVIPRYLYYVLSSDQFFTYDMNYSKGAKMPRGDKDAIMRYPLSIPSYDEQLRVVKILDNFEYLCSNISKGLTAEIEARQKQYEYYRDKLLSFKELES